MHGEIRHGQRLALASRPKARPGHGRPRGSDLVVADVFRRLVESRDAPPQLGPAIAHARRYRDLDDPEATDLALIDVAVAAMASMSRIRAAHPKILAIRQEQHRR